MSINMVVTVSSVFVNEDAKKKYDRRRILHSEKLELAAGDSLHDFMSRLADTIERNRVTAESSVSRITEMRERVAALSGDLAKYGFHDASKQIQRMVKDLAPVDSLNEEDDDEDI